MVSKKVTLYAVLSNSITLCTPEKLIYEGCKENHFYSLTKLGQAEAIIY